MTDTILPPALVKALKPECVAPVVLFLASKDCSETGQVIIQVELLFRPNRSAS